MAPQHSVVDSSTGVYVLNLTGCRPLLPIEQFSQVGLTVQIVLWTSGIVVLSLLINAPLIPLLLRLTRLCDISAIKVEDL